VNNHLTYWHVFDKFAADAVVSFYSDPEHAEIIRQAFDDQMEEQGRFFLSPGVFFNHQM